MRRSVIVFIICISFSFVSADCCIAAQASLPVGRLAWQKAMHKDLLPVTKNNLQ